MILEACQDFSVDPEYDCMFIGDTLSDMQAAKAAGVERRILVQTGYGFDLMENRQASNPPQLITNSELSSVAPFYYAANLAEAVADLTKN
ncbi:hypothetical protein ACHAXN_001205 [Cyclotella atomus]